MALTREQILAATAILALAGGGGGGAGGGAGAGSTAGAGGGGGAGSTAGAGKGGGGGGAAGKKPPSSGGGGQRKVSTQQGAAHFHLPIGALIIAHGKPVSAAPEHIAGDKPGDKVPDAAEVAADKAGEDKGKGWIPESKWLAGQKEWEALWKAHEWKDKDLGSSFHIWAGGHMFSVPHDADVWVPGDVSTHGKDVDVAHAKKIITFGEPGSKGKAAALLANGKFQEIKLDDALMAGLQAHGKKLAAGENKMAVKVGDATHWVPEGWLVFQHAGIPENLFAKDTEGHWHTLTKSGTAGGVFSPGLEKAMDAKVGGALTLYKHPVTHDTEHPPPKPTAKAGVVGGKVMIPGQGNVPIEVTHTQIAKALELLNNDGSTQVKLPLKKAGNPLANMDYHAISKAEIFAHPELKLAKGSKQAHVGQVKFAILHYLAALLETQPANQAEEAAAQEVTAAVEAAVDHSHEMASTTVTLGAASAGFQEIKKLPEPAKPGEAKSSVKPPEPLHEKAPSAGYQQFIKDKSAAQPVSGTQQVGGVEVTKEDLQVAINVLESHPTSTAIKQLLKGAKSPLAVVDYHKIIDEFKASHDPKLTKGLLARPVFMLALKEALGTTQLGDSLSLTDAAKDLDALLAGQHPTLQTNGTFTQMLPQALLWAQEQGQVKFLADSAAIPGNVVLLGNKPADGGLVYQITPDHHVTFVSSAGVPGEMAADAVLAVVKEQLAEPEQKAPEKVKIVPPKPAPGTIPVSVWVHLDQAEVGVGEVPEGSQVFVASSTPHHTQKYIKLPDGSWVKANADGIKPVSKGSWDAFNSMAEKAGEAGSSLTQESGPVSPPESELAGIPVSVSGKVLAHVPEGSKIFGLPEDTASSNKWVLFPDDTPWIVGPNQPGGISKTQGFMTFVDDGTLVLLDGQGKPVEVPKDTTKAKIEHLVSMATQSGTGQPLSSKLAEAMLKVQVGPVTKMFVEPSMGGGWHKTFSPSTAKMHFRVGKTSISHTLAVWVSSEPNAAEGVLSPEDVLDILQGKHPDENGPAVVMETVPPEPEPAPEPEPEPPGIPVIVDGKLSSDKAPAGSKFYLYSSSSGQSYDKSVYIKKLDGSFAKATEYSIVNQSSTYHHFDKEIADGELVEIQPPTEEQLAEVKDKAEIKKKIENGAVEPGIANTTWQAQMVNWLAGTSSSTDIHIFADPNHPGQFKAQTWAPGGGIASHEVSGSTLTGMHHLADGSTHILMPFSEVKAAVQEHLTEDAVLVGHPKKLVKFGNYYSPKGKGAFLEVKAATSSYGYNASYKYGSAAKADFISHKQDGSSSKVTPAFAVKKLETATEFHPPGQAKEFVLKPKAGSGAATFVTALGPAGGDFFIVSVKDSAVKTDEVTISIKSDGSAVIHYPGSNGHQTLTAVDNLLKTGAIVDQFGTSVVKPGVEPAAFYVFGTKLTPADVDNLLEEMAQNFTDMKALGAVLQAHIPTISVAKNTGWLPAHGVEASGTAQRDAIMALLRELQQVPAGKISIETMEPTFLKGLPPGINGPGDIFTFTAAGHARPFEGELPSADQVDWALTSPELAKFIKDISAQFGEGKVLGTHPASLSKDARQEWLKAFLKGDMATVFKLDASSGKVSLAHPGAPDNTSTHQLTWAPWGEGQIPAGQAVEGAWTTDPEITLPKAEVDNFIIKAGLQHAEHLSDSQRREWVLQHRNGNQALVDTLSRQAAQGFEGGWPVQSEVPKWTDDIKPATSFDVFLENKTPASAWTHKALNDFFTTHFDDLLQPFDVDGYGKDYESTAARRQVIRRFLEDKEAKEIAEKSKPVYALKPGAPTPAATHPIYEITATVPLTGEVTPMFFKPVAPGKEFIAEQAHFAAELGKLFGFRTPPSRLIEFNGEFGQAQVKLPATGDLEYGAKLGFYDHAPIPFADLTQRQLSDIAREHLFDWAIDNNDSRAANFLLMPDGSIVGIDKDRAWRDWGTWPGLAGDGTADQQSALVSTALFNAIRDGTISGDAAIQTFLDVMHRAQHMQRLSDDRLRMVMEKALEHRTKFFHGSKEDVIQAAIDRKNSLVADFTALYQKVFTDAGLGELPEVPVAKLPVLGDGTQLHSGFSEPEFMDHVFTSASHGQPAFFGGPELEGGHFIVWQEFEGAGTDNLVIRGQSAARGQALEDITQWAQEHQSGAPASAPKVPIAPGKTFVKNADEWLSAITAAAKTVSHHVEDQQFNQDKLTAMAKAKQQMEAQITLAESVIGDAAKTHAFTTEAGFGTPEATISAVQHFLPLVEKVLNGQANHVKFKIGDIPEWKPPTSLPEPAKPAEAPKPPPPPPDVKVVLKEPTRPRAMDGEIGEDGELHTHASNVVSFDGGERAFHITLSTGEVIEVWPEGKVERAHVGRIAFKAVAADGSASLERIRSQLQEMGLDMREAEETDLHLFYFRHLAGILADRVDGTEGKHGEVWGRLKVLMTEAKLEWNSHSMATNANALASASLTAEEELAIWHEAWAQLTSTEQLGKFVDAKGWMPRMRHLNLKNPGKGSGNPFWWRFDVTFEQVAKKKNPSGRFGGISLGAIRSGAVLSRDERIRVTGSDSANGQSNPFESGATGFVFTRLNRHVTAHADIHAVYSPTVLAHTSTYGFSDDSFGNIYSRSTGSYFGFTKAAAHTGESNETTIKEAISLMDEVEILIPHNESERKAIISYLQGLGIYEIRGVPVTERVLEPGQDPTAAIAAVRAAMKAEHFGWWDL